MSILLAASFLIFPDAFLLQSVPKLYFPNYYQAGELYWLIVLWCTVVQAYSLVELFLAYRPADPIMKNRIICLLIGYVLGYGFGSLAYFLTFNIPVDPVWSSFFIPMFSIPFTYALIKYELSDIRIIAKQALIYFILIEILGVIISLFILFTDYIRQTFPNLPIWTLPIFFAILFVSVGVFIWRRLSETDVLKYEFITVVTHKFRTPLTRIKWAAEDISGIIPAEKKESIDTILESEKQLLTLTNILVHLSAADVSRFDYHPAPMDIGQLFTDLSAQYAIRAKRKGIVISFSSSPGLFVLADAEKSIFIFQILLDNALNYTPAGNGSISVRAYVSQNGKHGVIEVSDTGIGMSPETASRVFRRFYRGENAKHTDTEGMGIGLFIAKSIVEKQDGKIYVRSEGEGKGSTFSIYLPLYKPVK